MAKPRRELPVLEPDYSYRRRLSATDLVPALGIGLAVGLAGFYVVRVLLQRTTLVPPAERVAVIKQTPSDIYRRSRKRLPKVDV